MACPWLATMGYIFGKAAMAGIPQITRPRQLIQKLVLTIVQLLSVFLHSSRYSIPFLLVTITTSKSHAYFFSKVPSKNYPTLINRRFYYLV